ncbi:FAD-dependent oxidoreductase [Phycicoccus sp. Root563]|uniref:FAD-dependent oxidoreductase n=1 Tax=Phycicoccus sp. Root563 TaxID=1736562 RepID=UPI0009E842BB|nr:FAD-dependent oxidoreductase [Phycicoccus sp. Root563]
MSITQAITQSAPIPVADPPVVVIGGGPVGLAAAAHLVDRGMSALVLEAGDHVGTAMTQWGHIRTFTPWQYIVDEAAEQVLAPTGWTRPTERQSPTGADIVDRYLRPLADALGPDVVRTGVRVLAVSRDGLDRSRTVGRADRPFVVRVQHTDGAVEDLQARAVIDASGTWEQHNPLGSSGLAALGEEQARTAGFLVGPLPDVLGADRARFAGRTTLVVGMGHSAANTLLALAQLAREVPGTRIVWAIRGTSARRVFGGGTDDQLADRGRLGSDLQDLVTSGALEYVTGFATRQLDIHTNDTVSVVGDTADGERLIASVHNIAAATGFRPDLAMLSELQLDLDPSVQAPRALGPLIDPSFHSCGTVSPHGWRELAHEREPGFFTVGMKSYGRAPTFLITTGNEQVRSIAAHLAGDDAAADEVQLVLPETGVCSSSNALSDDEVATGVQSSGGCCDTTPDVAIADPATEESLERLRVGFATGVPNGRAGDLEAQPTTRTSLALASGTSPSSGGGCCG